LTAVSSVLKYYFTLKLAAGICTYWPNEEIFIVSLYTNFFIDLRK